MKDIFSFLDLYKVEHFLCRLFESTDRIQGNPTKGILDGELVWEFINLPWKEKLEVSKKIGSKVDEIIDDLMEVDRISAHF